MTVIESGLDALVNIQNSYYDIKSLCIREIRRNFNMRYGKDAAMYTDEEKKAQLLISIFASKILEAMGYEVDHFFYDSPILKETEDADTKAD